MKLSRVLLSDMRSDNEVIVFFKSFFFPNLVSIASDDITWIPFLGYLFDLITKYGIFKHFKSYVAATYGNVTLQESA